MSHFCDHFSSLWSSVCITEPVTLCFHPNYCKGKSFSQPCIWKNNPLIIIRYGGGGNVKVRRHSLRNSHRRLFPVRFTYRIVVWGETAGTVSKFRCIHLTVVRKHKQRLGQQTTECGPLVSSNKATGRSRHEDKSWPAPSAIAC